MRIFLFNIVLLFFISVFVSNADWIKITDDQIQDGFEESSWLEVFFLPANPLYGWLCGHDGKILMTTDGGNSWTGSTVHKGGQLESIIFLNERVGYTSGSSGIFKSIDGGISWTDISPRSQGNFYWGCYFIDVNNGFLIGDGCNSPMIPQKFHKTTDGGNTWETSEYNVDESGLTDVRIIQKDALAYAVSSGFLWYTINGGRRWQIVSSTGSRSWHEELSIYGNSFLIPFSGECSGGNFGSAIYGGSRFSDDGGNTWRETDVKAPMFGTFLLDDSTGWMCGQLDALYKTTDAGRSWSPDNCGIEYGTDLDDIYFLGADFGWVVGYHSIYKFGELPTLDPIIQSEGDTIICQGDQLRLFVDGDYDNIEWSNGARSNSIWVEESGTYFAEVWHDNCPRVKSKSVSVIVHPRPLVSFLMPDGKLCEGDTIRLVGPAGFDSYLWSTGETTQTIFVHSPGAYSLQIIDQFGCIGNNTILVDMISVPSIKIETQGNTDICQGDSITIIITGDINQFDVFKDGISYDIGPISGDAKIIILKEKGTYQIIGRSPNGCEGMSNTLDINIKNDSNRLEFFPIQFIGDQFNAGTQFISILSCFDLRVFNRGSDPFIINDGIYFLRNLQFSLPPAQFPISIPAYSETSIQVCFNSYGTGVVRDSLFIWDVCSPHMLPFVADVDDIRYYANNRCGTTLRQISNNYQTDKFYAADPYPNPATSSVQIEFADFNSAKRSIPSMRIYNIFGELIQVIEPSIALSKEIANGFLTEGAFLVNDLDNYANGIYMAVVSVNGNIHSFNISILE